MIRAKTEQLKHIPWFAKAGAASSIVPISRFVGPSIFALKGGGYGCLFSLSGLDEEGLTDLELESRVRSIEGSLRGLPEGSCLYQYTRVMSGFDLPRAGPLREQDHGDLRERPDHISKSKGWLPPDRSPLVPDDRTVTYESSRPEVLWRTPSRPRGCFSFYRRQPRC